MYHCILHYFHMPSPRLGQAITNRQLPFILRPRHRAVRVSPCNSRSISWLGLATPPLAFGGLLIGLWTYKCMMMIVFQNKIIYMPSVPPFSRSEKIDDYKYPASVKWKAEHIKSTDGTKLALAVGTIETDNQPSLACKPTTVIAYFQG